MCVQKPAKEIDDEINKIHANYFHFQMEMQSPDNKKRVVNYSWSLKHKNWAQEKIKSKIFSRCRYRAEEDILDWQRHYSITQYYKKHPKSPKKKFTDIPIIHKKIPITSFYKIIMKEYHFIIYNKEGQYANPLMMFIDDLNDANRFGTYTMDPERIKGELSLVNPNFHNYQYKDFTMFARMRCPHINIFDDNNKLGYIPVQNGLYDEKKQKLVPFDYHKIFNQKILTNYNSKATKDVHIKNWSPNRFLRKALGKAQTKTFWQMMYAIVNPDYVSDKLFWLKGDSQGSNGKSTLEHMITNVIGSSNVATTRITDFGNDFGLANLPNTLCDIGDNINSKSHIGGSGSDNFHSLVTGEFVDINIKNINPYSFCYKGVFIMSSNGFPQFDDNNGIKRRIIPLVMTHHFPSNNDDVKFNYFKNQSVREYILYKALHSKPKNHKFYVSATSRDALNNLMANSSPVAAFAKNKFLTWNLTRLPTMTCFAAYIAWAKTHNFSSKMSTRTFEDRFSAYINSLYKKKSARIRKSDYKNWLNIYSKDDLFKHLTDDDANKLDKYQPKVGDNVSCYILKPNVKIKQNKNSKVRNKKSSNDDLSHNKFYPIIITQQKELAKDKANDDLPF